MHPNPYFHKLLPLGLVVLLACGKKDDPAAEQPALRLFSNGAEITDAGARNAFLARHAAAFTPLAAGPSDKVVFNAAGDSAWFAPGTMRFGVEKHGDHHLFYSPQVVQVSAGNMQYRDLLRYTAPLVPVPCGIGGPLGGCYVTKEVRTGTRSGQQLMLSYLQYYWATISATGVRLHTQGSLFNELNAGIAGKVLAADTLAVRTATVSVPVK